MLADEQLVVLQDIVIVDVALNGGDDVPDALGQLDDTRAGSGELALCDGGVGRCAKQAIHGASLRRHAW